MKKLSLIFASFFISILIANAQFTGFTGFTGLSGFTGFSGLTGSTGSSGSSGSTGFTGFSGLTGSTGSSGSSGFTGFTGTTTTKEINSIVNQVSVYPNPASRDINIISAVDASIIEIVDITGRLEGSFLMTNNKVNIPTTTFIPGTYIYILLNHEKVAISRGKFQIVK